jgi:two-component system, cell cycle sensor histidine kinase PleC
MQMSARDAVTNQAYTAPASEAGSPLGTALAEEPTKRVVPGFLPQPGKYPRVFFVWGFCLATIATIWLVFAVYAAQERSRIYDLAGRELLGAQSVLRAHARRNYESTRAMLGIIDHWLASADRPSGPRPLSELEDLIAILQAYNEEPLAIRLIDSKGMMFRLAPRDAGNPGVDFSDRPYVQALRDAAPGTMKVGPTVRRGPVSYVMPIAVRTHPNAYDIAMLMGADSVENFSRAYTDLLVTAPATLGIIQNDSTVLFTWPENDAIAGKIVPGFSDRLGSRPAGERALIELPSIDGSGSTTLTGYASAFKAPIVVFASYQRRDLDRIWIHDIAIGFLACLGMSAAVALFAVTVGRMMRRDAVKTLALQDALLQARNADRAKKNFLAGMSHELRTPLNAIIGFSDLMRAETFGPLGAPHYKSYSADISEAGRHLLTIIHEILDTARVEQGAIELGTTPIKIDNTVAQTLAMLQPVAAAKSILVTSDVAPGLPLIRMSKTHLQQVLFNLLGNAIKFSATGAPVHLCAKLIEGGDGWIEICIKDRGIGIPRQRIGELFRPFSKIDDGYVRNAEGIGLGLANSKLIVEAYGGTIRLDSELGAGTRAIFTLPAGRALPAAVAAD